MAFPTTSVLDNFDRANGALGSNWTDVVESGDASPSITTNAVGAANGAFGSSAWNPATFLNCEAYHTITAGSSALDTSVLYLRLTNQNTGSVCCYIIVNQTTGIDLYRLYNNSYSSSLNNYGDQIAAGHKLGATVETVGGDIVITVYVDLGSGWTLLGTYTDTGAVASYPLLNAAGRIGFQILGSGDTTRQIDDFGGGEIVTVTLDDCLPDADVTTTGWATAPLFSKVNDASDATVIQATAS